MAASARAKEAQDWLAKRLAGGPLESRSLLAAAAENGITPKALRRAREALRLEVTRSGFGPAIRSTWALPSDEWQARHECVSERSLIGFTEGETWRTARRVAYFQGKGMQESDALRLAHNLVLNRDRTGANLTSCAECQNYTATGECRARMEGPGEGPREVIELWHCYLARVEIS